MPRPSRQPLINCNFYVWRLFIRGGVYYADGRSNRPRLGKHSLATTERDEALTRLKALDTAKAREQGLCTSAPTSASSGPSIASGWDLYVRHSARPEILGGTASITRKRFRSVRTKHEQYCRSQGVDDWSQVNAPHITAYGHLLESQEFAPRTIHYELGLLKAVHRFLMTDKHLPESLRFHLPLRRPPGSDTYCYRPEQVRRMLEHCEQNSALHWLHRVILMLALTGLRIGELISLRRSDIQRDDDGTFAFLRVANEGSRARRDESLSRRRTKGRRSRLVPVNSGLESLLNSLPVRTDGVLFLTDKGQPVSYNVILSTFVERVIKPLSSEFPTVVGQIGFEKGRLHSFRHYFVSQSLINGASEGEIRDWIGHADTGLIDLYRHLAADESRRRMQHLNLLGEQPVTDGPSRAPAGPSRSASQRGRMSTGECPLDEV